MRKAAKNTTFPKARCENAGFVLAHGTRTCEGTSVTQSRRGRAHPGGSKRARAPRSPAPSPHGAAVFGAAAPAAHATRRPAEHGREAAGLPFSEAEKAPSVGRGRGRERAAPPLRGRGRREGGLAAGEPGRRAGGAGDALEQACDPSAPRVAGRARHLRPGGAVTWTQERGEKVTTLQTTCLSLEVLTASKAPGSIRPSALGADAEPPLGHPRRLGPRWAGPGPSGPRTRICTGRAAYRWPSVLSAPDEKS